MTDPSSNQPSNRSEFERQLTDRLQAMADHAPRQPSHDPSRSAGRVVVDGSASRGFRIGALAAVAAAVALVGGGLAWWWSTSEDDPLTAEVATEAGPDSPDSADSADSADSTEDGADPDDGATADGDTTADDSVAWSTTCDAEDVAERLRAGTNQLTLPGAEASTSLEDLYQRSVAVVRARVLWTEPEVRDRVEGTRLVVSGGTWWIGSDERRTITELWFPSADAVVFDATSGPPGGLDVVAFIDREIPAIDAAAVRLDGLWVACANHSDDSGPGPAVPVLAEPTAPGWNEVLAGGVTLDELTPLAITEEEAAMVAPMPVGPLAPRHGHALVWTGTEMIAWGGWADVAGATAFADGAAFDPATETWRPIAPSPLTGRRDAVAVWMGSEMLVWGGYEAPGVDRPESEPRGALYDPVSDRWRLMTVGPLDPAPTFPLDPRTIASVWTSSGLILWDTLGDRVVRYDPDTDRWDEFAPPGLGVGLGTLHWSEADNAVMATGVGRLEPGANLRTGFKPLDDSPGDPWVPVPSVSLSTDRLSEGANPVLTAWAGDRLLTWTRSGPAGATRSWKPGSETWADEAPVPLTPTEGYWPPLLLDDGRVLAIGEIDGAVFDPASDGWSVVPSTGVLAGGSLAAGAKVWTGSELLVWDVECCFGQGELPYQSQQAVRVRIDGRAD